MGKLSQISAELPPVAAARIAGKLLNLHSPHEIAEAISVLMDVLDFIGGDPEAEEVGAEDSFQDHPSYGPGCPISDSADDQSWREWNNLPGAVKRAGGHGGAFIEDAEDDDPDRAHDEGEPDYGLQPGEHDGPGCDISDTGGDEHDGCEPEYDAETIALEDDVPMLPVVSYV